MAKGLAQAGANIAIAARDESAASVACLEIERDGGVATFIPVDVADDESCRSIIAKTVSRFGRLDILVNNAGIAIAKQPEEFTVEEFNHVMQVNLTGAVFLLKGGLPAHEKRGWREDNQCSLGSGLSSWARHDCVRTFESRNGPNSTSYGSSVGQR
jgi:2-deoxy-D-gluconate 3-dehydrogenase